MKKPMIIVSGYDAIEAMRELTVCFDVTALPRLVRAGSLTPEKAARVLLDDVTNVTDIAEAVTVVKHVRCPARVYNARHQHVCNVALDGSVIFCVAHRDE